MTETPAAPGNTRRVAITLLAVYGVFWTQFALVRADNFGGIDEWLILSLVSRGTIDIPYANRPLGLLFNLPVALFPAHLLQASLLLHAHYLVLAGLLTSLLLLRLAPDRPDWALLAGVFAAVYAPSDLLRLDGIYSSAYAGVAAATALVLLLLVAGARRPVLVVVAAGLAFVLTRVHEGALPVLLLAPVFLWGLRARLPRAPLAGYYGVMGLALLVAGLPFVRGRPEVWYQHDLLQGFNGEPGILASRFVTQFLLHVAPLITVAGVGLVNPRTLAASGMLVLALALSKAPAAAASSSRRRFAFAVVVGIVGAAAAYSGFIVSSRTAAGANRAEILSAPWIGLGLSAAILLLGEAVPSPARPALVAALGVVVTAVSGVRTAQLQQLWDRTGFFARHARDVKQIVATAPDFEPGTLVMLFDGAGTWLGSFVFHHALDLVYGRQVAGCVANGHEEIFYVCQLDPGGVYRETWPVVRTAWGAWPRHYSFDQIVIFRSDTAGRVTLLDEWPSELAPLPPGAAYRPRARIRSSGTPPASRAILTGSP
jgi:hypothetical protein